MQSKNYRSLKKNVSIVVIHTPRPSLEKKRARRGAAGDLFKKSA